LKSAEFSKKLKEEATLEDSGWPMRRTYDAIDDSLTDSFTDSYMRPGAHWGFVVVRAVYGPSSDALWVQILELFRTDVVETLTLEGQIDLLPRHKLTVIEDAAILDGADSCAVRRASRV
jgi:hypothetical protein